MLKLEQRVVDLLHKLQTALGQGNLDVKDFPLEDIGNLIDTALGEPMWNSIGSRPQGVFLRVGQEYRQGFARSMEKNDAEQCIQLLKLLECQYQSFYAAMSREEQLYREETLRKMVIKTGSAYAAVQARELCRRQEGWMGESDVTGYGRGVVYTCAVKNEKQLPLPEYQNVFWDYICFTDREELAGKRAGVWEFRSLKGAELEHPADAYYKYKVKPHEMLKEYDYSIWVDPQVQIVGELERFYQIYGRRASFLGFPAYDQDDIYEALSTSMTEDDENVRLRGKLMQYRKEGFPEHYGMINTQMMFRVHRDENLRRVMEDWWKEMHECKALIDCGFSYAAWKNGFRYALCDLFAEDNAYIKNGDIDLELDLERNE